MTKQERTEQKRKWRSAHKEQNIKTQRAWWLKTLFNLTFEEWENLFKSQDGRCAICGSKMIGYRNCHTDHLHGTKQVRGLLCRKCNVMLGHANDNSEILNRAVGYLKRI